MKRLRASFGWVRRYPARSAAAAFALVIAMPFLLAAMRAPSLERAWVSHLAHMPGVEIDMASGAISVAALRDWQYGADGPTATGLIEASYDFDALEAVWFVVEPHPSIRGMAHTLLLFQFADERLLGLTIEARRESHEDFSAWQGLFNAFELHYVWASARDLLVRRALYLDHEVYVYPVVMSPAEERTLLTTLLQETRALETSPRFYNTLFSNCTNELGKHARIRWHPSFVLTGLSPSYLHQVERIPGATFAEAKDRARMTETIKRLAGEEREAFDRALLSALAGTASP